MLGWVTFLYSTPILQGFYSSTIQTDRIILPSDTISISIELWYGLYNVYIQTPLLYIKDWQCLNICVRCNPIVQIVKTFDETRLTLGGWPVQPIGCSSTTKERYNHLTCVCALCFSLVGPLQQTTLLRRLKAGAPSPPRGRAEELGNSLPPHLPLPLPHKFPPAPCSRSTPLTRLLLPPPAHRRRSRHRLQRLIRPLQLPTGNNSLCCTMISWWYSEVSKLELWIESYVLDNLHFGLWI